MAQSPFSLLPAGIAQSVFSPSYASICRISEGEVKAPFPQVWSTDGGGRKYPIVGDKYFDGKTGQIVTTGPDNPWVTFGPPTLDVYWHNLGSIKTEDAFCGAVKSSGLSMTEYVIRVGEFLKECKCDLRSLTATTYSVNVVTFSNMSSSDFTLLWKRYGL